MAETENEESGKRFKLKVVEEKGTGEEEIMEGVAKKENGEAETVNDNKKNEVIRETAQIEEKNRKNIQKSNKDRIPFWILFIAFVIGLSIGAGLIGGIFYYRSKVSKLDLIESTKEPEKSPTTTPAVVIEEKPVQEEVDFSKYSLQILNGSGIKGLASKTSKLLEDIGFGKIDVGNANSYSYTKTEISLKESVPDKAYDAIKSVLKENYVLEKQSEFLSDDSEYDIQIIVGSEQPSSE